MFSRLSSWWYGPPPEEPEPEPEPEPAPSLVWGTSLATKKRLITFSGIMCAMIVVGLAVAAVLLQFFSDEPVVKVAIEEGDALVPGPHVMSLRMNFSNAHSYCADKFLSGKLAVVYSEEEEDLLMKRVKKQVAKNKQASKCEAFFVGYRVILGRKWQSVDRRSFVPALSIPYQHPFHNDSYDCFTILLNTSVVKTVPCFHRYRCALCETLINCGSVHNSLESGCYKLTSGDLATVDLAQEKEGNRPFPIESDEKTGSNESVSTTEADDWLVTAPVPEDDGHAHFAGPAHPMEPVIDTGTGVVESPPGIPLEFDPDEDDSSTLKQDGRLRISFSAESLPLTFNEWQKLCRTRHHGRLAAFLHKNMSELIRRETLARMKRSKLEAQCKGRVAARGVIEAYEYETVKEERIAYHSNWIRGIPSRHQCLAIQPQNRFYWLPAPCQHKICFICSRSEPDPGRNEPSFYEEFDGRAGEDSDLLSPVWG